MTYEDVLQMGKKKGGQRQKKHQHENKGKKMKLEGMRESWKNSVYKRTKFYMGMYFF